MTEDEQEHYDRALSFVERSRHTAGCAISDYEDWVGRHRRPDCTCGLDAALDLITKIKG